MFYAKIQNKNLELCIVKNPCGTVTVSKFLTNGCLNSLVNFSGHSTGH